MAIKPFEVDMLFPIMEKVYYSILNIVHTPEFYQPGNTILKCSSFPYNSKFRITNVEPVRDQVIESIRESFYENT